ncbi:MAG: PAS domain-containing protein, partial [Betaproteobacteria bacterium]|nr:PAS domain-containing protein [Betaproteobacteria bacterium]
MAARDVVLPVSRESLDRWEILDTQPEEAFDSLARRAARELKTTMAAISFFDRPLDAALPWREWFKSAIGFPARALSKRESFFLPAADADTPPVRSFAVPDLFAEKRFRDHRLVHGAPHLACYAGAAILGKDREIVGALAVFDTVARDFSSRDMQTLEALADEVASRLEARLIARKERLPAQSDYADFTEPPDAQMARLSHEVSRLETMLENEITTRRAAEEKLSKEKEFASAAIQSLPGAFFMFDVHGRLVRWNESFAQTTGYREEEVRTMHAIDFVAPEDRERTAEAIRTVLIEGRETAIESAMVRRDGMRVPYLFEGRALDIGGMRYCIGVGRDISERLQADKEIRRAKERLDMALTGSNLAIWDWDLVGNEVTFSADWEHLLRAKVTDKPGIVFSGIEVIDWNHPEDRERLMNALVATAKGESQEFLCEYRVRGVDQEWVWIQSKGKVVETDPATGHSIRMAGTSSNVTMKKAAEDRVEFLATRDPLTKLPNRTLLNDRLEHGVANAARKKARLAFMFIDLDRFKSINDTLG